MRKIGQLLSAMIFQNIAVIIAVGIIREIFGIYGWWYNDQILLLVDPIYNVLLPILLGYTGGKLIGGQRGGVVASFVTYGLVLASSVPAILGAMIVGPLTGWLVNRVDQLVKRRIPVGFELLVTNVVAAILAVTLSIVCFLYIGKLMSMTVKSVMNVLESFAYTGLLPLTAIIIEPAKVFFFNNIINFGLVGPLGIHHAKDLGKSIFYLLESNPGPGLGVLLAYWFKTKGERRTGAKLATFIHAFGGIHEVYFPYVLLSPTLLIAVICGGITGNFIFQFFDVGLVSIASPGSIFLILGLTPREDILFVFLGIFMSTAVSYIVSILLLDSEAKSPSFKDNEKKVAEFEHLSEIDKMTNGIEQRWLSGKEDVIKSKLPVIKTIKSTPIKKIIFACEAGMGSSAMGAALLRKKLMQTGMIIDVNNMAISKIPHDADLIICHEKLLNVVREVTPDKHVFALSSFTDMERYEQIIKLVKDRNSSS